MDLYRFYNASDELLYIGISLSAFGRAAQHRATQPWWNEVARMEREGLDGDRNAALEIERLAILREKPRYNVIHNRSTRAASSATGIHQPWKCTLCGGHIKKGREQGYVQLDGYDLWQCACRSCDQDSAISGSFSARYWIDSKRITTAADIVHWSSHLAGKQWFCAGEWADMLRVACLIPNAHRDACRALDKTFTFSHQ